MIYPLIHSPTHSFICPPSIYVSAHPSIHSFTYPSTHIYPSIHTPTHLLIHPLSIHSCIPYQYSPSTYSIHILGLQLWIRLIWTPQIGQRDPPTDVLAYKGGDSVYHGVSWSHFSRTTLFPSGLQVTVNQRPLYCQVEGFQPQYSNITGKIYVTTHKPLMIL